MTKKEKEYEKEISELKARIEGLEKEGNLSGVKSIVGGILPGLDQLVEKLTSVSPEFKKRIEETDTKIKKNLESGVSRKPVISYGYTVRTLVPSDEGELDITSVREQTRKKTEPLKPKEEQREPLIDIFDDRESIIVIAEMPGAKEDEIDVAIENDKLRISGGKYSKELKLPATPERIVERRYKNGILEVKLKKKD